MNEIITYFAIDKTDEVHIEFIKKILKKDKCELLKFDKKNEYSVIYSYLIFIEYYKIIKKNELITIDFIVLNFINSDCSDKGTGYFIFHAILNIIYINYILSGKVKDIKDINDITILVKYFKYDKDIGPIEPLLKKIKEEQKFSNVYKLYKDIIDYIPFFLDDMIVNLAKTTKNEKITFDFIKEELVNEIKLPLIIIVISYFMMDHKERRDVINNKKFLLHINDSIMMRQLCNDIKI